MTTVKKQIVETRKNEIRSVTSDPRMMLNKHIAKRVLKSWNEDFSDEDTGEVITIERNEILFEKGTYINQDVLAKIRFSMQADGISEIEVSNQRRIGFEHENTYLYPWLAQIALCGKKYKFLLYATSVDNAVEILKDYAELNYTSGFSIIMVKQFDSCIILSDKLKKIDKAEAYLKDEIEAGELLSDESEENEADKKFFQIDTKIVYDDEVEDSQSFVVNTFDIDRSMMVISNYISKNEDDYYKEMTAKGISYEKREFKLGIDKAVPIPIGVFIPKEFSMAYSK